MNNLNRKLSVHRAADGTWGTEQRPPTPPPFSIGDEFQLRVTAGATGYEVWFIGTSWAARFPYRSPPSLVTSINQEDKTLSNCR